MTKMNPRLSSVAPMNLSKVIGGFKKEKKPKLSMNPRLSSAAPMNLSKVIGGFNK